MSSTRKERELHEEKDWEKVDEAVFSSASFLYKYQKQLIIAVVAVFVIVGGYLAYKNLVVAPKNNEAQVAMIKGQEYFQAGIDSLALNGDGNGYIGFIGIIDEYGSTPAGNLANAYAGLSYARLKQYEKAIPYLQKFNGNDVMVAPSVKSAIGDCLVNTGKVEEGAAQFEKAAKDANDQLLSPIFYKKAALAYRSLKNHDKVISLFTTIQNDYMASPEAMDAQKYIEEATILKGGAK